MFEPRRSAVRRFWGVALAAVMMLPTAGSAAPPSNDVLHHDCWDVVSFISAPADAVRPHVPSHFRLQGEASGTAMLFIRSAACAGMTVRGITTPTTFSHFAALVEPLEPKENICAVPAASRYNLCSWYVFEMATDNAVLAGWVREGTSAGTAVRHVPGMSFRFERTGGTLLYSFRLPAPASSPFTMAGTISAHETTPWCEDEFCLWVDYYFETPQELLHIGGASDLTSHVGVVEVIPARGTLMADMFAPMSSRTSSTSFAYNRWDPGVWTKTVVA